MTRLYSNTVGKGIPLVMLHGWGWHSGILEPLLPQLTQKYQVFLIDLPGFGQSQFYQGNFSFEKIVPDILKIVPEEAAWLGWSMGGLFATWTAIHFSHRVTHLINVASSPCFIQDKNWAGISHTILEKFSHLLAGDHKKTLLDFLELQLRGSPKRVELFSELKNILSLPDQQALHGGLKLLRDTDLRNDLKNITCPNLHIFGSLDTIVPVKIADQLPVLLPTANCHVIPHCGHIPFLTQRENFLDLLTSFFGSSR